MKQIEIFGTGSLKNIGRIAQRLNAKRILLVTGTTSFQLSGAKKILEKVLTNYDVTIFRDFEVNPKLRDIKKGIRLFKKTKPNLVIAVGGGSVIDVAKAINALAENAGNPRDYITGREKITKRGKPLIAVPTTSGSGSEATHFAVVYIGKTKYSLAHEYILPNYAIIDPNLTLKLPRKITAASGLDALSQAIESYWSVNATPVSKRYSAIALKLALKSIVASVRQPTRQSRAAMSRAAHLAGKAINLAKTTACHAISYPITSYFGVPHGHAVALTLSSLLRYNADISEAEVMDKRGVAYVNKTIKHLARLIAGSKDVAKAATVLDTILTGVGVETKLSRLNIKTDKDLNLIIKNGFNPDRVKNNPRLLTKEALRKILVNLV